MNHENSPRLPFASISSLHLHFCSCFKFYLTQLTAQISGKPGKTLYFPLLLGYWRCCIRTTMRNIGNIPQLNRHSSLWTRSLDSPASLCPALPWLPPPSSLSPKGKRDRPRALKPLLARPAARRLVVAAGIAEDPVRIRKALEGRAVGISPFKVSHDSVLILQNVRIEHLSTVGNTF